MVGLGVAAGLEEAGAGDGVADFCDPPECVAAVPQPAARASVRAAPAATMASLKDMCESLRRCFRPMITASQL